jgi:hypothetical protein
MILLTSSQTNRLFNKKSFLNFIKKFTASGNIEDFLIKN